MSTHYLFTKPHTHTHTLCIALLLALQEDTYSVFEFGGSLVVCFEVLNGILDIDVQPAANLFTQPGSALGMNTCVQTNGNKANIFFCLMPFTLSFLSLV